MLLRYNHVFAFVFAQTVTLFCPLFLLNVFEEVIPYLYVTLCIDRYINLFSPATGNSVGRCSVIIWSVPYGRVFGYFQTFATTVTICKIVSLLPSICLAIEENPTGSKK